LIYTGHEADTQAIDFYDISEALVGFQRSLALTTHLALTGEVITQAPYLRGARIFALPPEEGSWKITAAVVMGIYTAGTAPKDTPVGHLVSSLYDYAVSQTLGFHVDYNKTLGQQIEETKQSRKEGKAITEAKVDALIEKIETPIRQMHRPLIASETAEAAAIKTRLGGPPRQSQAVLTRETYDYVSYTKRTEIPLMLLGRVSSYNVNTFKGRLFVFDEARPIPFVLADNVRDPRTVGLITWSLDANARDKLSGIGDLSCTAFIDYSRTGVMKRLVIVGLSKAGQLT